MTELTPIEILKHRITLLCIDQKTIEALARIAPYVETCLDGVIEDFYAHLQKFPEGRRALGNPQRITALKNHQKQHWARLFNANLDDTYISESLRIGRAHYRANIPPHLYMAGHTFFQAAIVKRVASRFQNEPQLPLLMEAIPRIIGLDMDLAMSVYVREVWRGANAASSKDAAA